MMNWMRGWDCIIYLSSVLDAFLLLLWGFSFMSSIYCATLSLCYVRFLGAGGHPMHTILMMEERMEIRYDSKKSKPKWHSSLQIRTRGDEELERGTRFRDFSLGFGFRVGFDNIDRY